MVADADIIDQRESRWPRRVGWFVGIAAVGLALGIAAVATLRATDKPPALIPDQSLYQVKLDGTWKDAGGATIVFSAPTDLNGHGGAFTFTNVPNIFNFRSTGTPPSSGQGHWTVGDYAGSPDGILFTFEGSQWTSGNQPQVVLLAEGDPSSPALVCQYPDGQNTCTFAKQP